jgi:hypothetical protein
LGIKSFVDVARDAVSSRAVRGAKGEHEGIAEEVHSRVFTLQMIMIKTVRTTTLAEL